MKNKLTLCLAAVYHEFLRVFINPYDRRMPGVSGVFFDPHLVILSAADVMIRHQLLIQCLTLLLRQ